MAVCHMCRCVSIMPGMTMPPRASISMAPSGAVTFCPTSAILSSITSTSVSVSTDRASSIGSTVPPRKSTGLDSFIVEPLRTNVRMPATDEGYSDPAPPGSQPSRSRHAEGRRRTGLHRGAGEGPRGHRRVRTRPPGHDADGGRVGDGPGATDGPADPADADGDGLRPHGGWRVRADPAGAGPRGGVRAVAGPVGHRPPAHDGTVGGDERVVLDRAARRVGHRLRRAGGRAQDRGAGGPDRHAVPGTADVTGEGAAGGAGAGRGGGGAGGAVAVGPGAAVAAVAGRTRHGAAGGPGAGLGPDRPAAGTGHPLGGGPPPRRRRPGRRRAEREHPRGRDHGRPPARPPPPPPAEGRGRHQRRLRPAGHDPPRDPHGSLLTPRGLTGLARLDSRRCPAKTADRCPLHGRRLMKGPLDGVLVADFSRILAGPYATMLMADMGADVIKVEGPRGDDTRTWMPPVRDGVSTYYLGINRGKRSIALDLRDDVDAEAARELARRADVLIENFKPGGLDRFGLGYEDVRERNPGIVYASITGFGTGAGRDVPGYDLMVQAISGLMSLTGDPDGPPFRAGISVFDVMAGNHAVIGILAALRHREATGLGQRVDVNLLSSALTGLVNHSSAYAAGGVVPYRMGNAHPSVFPYEALPTADHDLIVAAANDGQFRKLCEVLELPELPDDPRFGRNQDRTANREQLRPILVERLRKRTTDRSEERRVG